MMDTDYDRTAIKDISKVDLQQLLIDKVEELHMDCGQQVAAEFDAHTVKKMLALLSAQYRSWAWGEFCAVCRQGIAGAYGNSSITKINFQSLSTWLKRAATQRNEIHANRSMAESKQHKTTDAQQDYAKNGKNWGPVNYLRFTHGLRYQTPAELGEVIKNDELPALAKQGLLQKYPYALTVNYPLK